MNKTPIIYVWIIKSISKRDDILDGCMQRNKFCTILGRSFKIPRERRQEIIKEMAKEGVIKEIGKFKIKLNL